MTVSGAMERPPTWARALRRARREWEGWLHTRADHRWMRQAPHLAGARERADILARWRGESGDDSAGRVLPGRLAERLAEWSEAHPGWRERITAQSAGYLRDEVVAFGRLHRIAEPQSWLADPWRPRSWPRRSHVRIPLNDPRSGGDARMTWEAARFHHAPALGRYGLATSDAAAAAAFLRQTAGFVRGNPAFRTVQWTVGMEAGIRAAAWALALEFLRGSSALRDPESDALLDALLLHGIYLEHHPDRHPDGHTTNHTVATAAGLAALGRSLDASACGRAWVAMAGHRLAEALRAQILNGGAHAEGSLPYERFVLEAALVGFRSLEPPDREPLREPLSRLARHLSEARLPDGLPYIGDGDDSFFPPFGLDPLDERDPLDPEPVLQAAEAVLGLGGLRRRAATEEAAFWLGAPVQANVISDPAPLAAPFRLISRATPESSGHRSDIRAPHPAETTAGGRGFLRFEAGPFAGSLIARGTGEGWDTTHAHNDLLSLLLTVAGTPLLVDPGTHGYAVDRPLRHLLRSTAAHSTLQFEDREQSPISPRFLFHGPPLTTCRARMTAAPFPRLQAWHDGFRDERSGERLRHMREIRWKRGFLWITDTLAMLPPPEEKQRGFGGARHEGVPDQAVTRGDRTVHSTLRFRFAPGLVPVLAPDPAAAIRSRLSCRVPVSAGTVELFVLRPGIARWHIVSGVVSRRYARRDEAAILEGTTEGPLAHRWRIALRLQPAR